MTPCCCSSGCSCWCGPISPAVRFLFHPYVLQTNHERAAAGLATVGNGTPVRGSIVKTRLMNVIFSDLMVPKLVAAGGELSRADLDQGVKSGEVFWAEVVVEYNKRDVPAYGKLAHDLPWTAASKPNPAAFKEITATKASESYKKLTKEYDAAYGNWKKSGNHQPFSDFTNDMAIRYFHEFAFALPNILSIVIKSLAPDVFSESTNNGGGRKRKSGPSRSKGAGGAGDSEAMTQIAATQTKRTELYRAGVNQEMQHKNQEMQHKNQEMQHKNQEMQHKIQNQLRSMRTERRDFIEKIGGKDVLAKLRETESQDTSCEEVDEMENQIVILKKALKDLQKTPAEHETMPPPASPSA
jgi:hypothetical protein